MRTIEKYLWKDDVMNVVFISGPHGCGKTAFMEALLEKMETKRIELDTQMGVLDTLKNLLH